MRQSKNRIAILIIAALTMLPTVASSAPALNAANGHYYDRIDTPSAINWFAADSAASGMSYLGLQGHLATITSAQENDFIINNLGGALTQGLWLGGFQPNPASPPADGWEWVTGEAWSYTNWKAGEPSDAGGPEDGLHFSGSAGAVGFWNDLSRTDTRMGYIVEFSSAPEPSSLSLIALGLLLARWNRRGQLR